MPREPRSLLGRAASAALSLLVAAAALASALPLAHGHLGVPSATASWCDAAAAGGPEAGPDHCSLCFARGHSPAAPPADTATPAQGAAARLAEAAAFAPRAADRRGPAEPRAPPRLA